jgi:signal transduction histidine kinase
MRSILPGGLPSGAWARRHRGVLLVLGAHAVGLAIFGLAMGAEPLHALLEGGAVALIAAVAAWPKLPQRARSGVAAFGLMSASAILVHLSGGYIEAHFHYFVMLGVVFLYEDWMPYTLAVGFVALHHGIMGTLDAASVFNHPAASAHPWLWAGIHALFVLGLSAALVVAWRVVQGARLAEAAAQREALDTKRQLHAGEKMAALGSLAAGLAHEVRTPLTAVSTNAALIERDLRRNPGSPEAAERIAACVRDIHLSVDRMNALVGQLKRFHRLDGEGRVDLPLEGVVKEAVDFFTTAHRTASPIQLELEPTHVASLDPLGVHQVVINLLSNAVEACDPAEGVVVVRTFNDAGRPCLVVQDNGVGMSQETQRRLFEPLFTTKPTGTGLGLAIVKRIVAAHGGDIRCSSEPGKGTTFRVRFAPAAPRTSIPVSVAEADARATFV